MVFSDQFSQNEISKEEILNFVKLEVKFKSVKMLQRIFLYVFPIQQTNAYIFQKLSIFQYSSLIIFRNVTSTSLKNMVTRKTIETFRLPFFVTVHHLLQTLDTVQFPNLEIKRRKYKSERMLVASWETFYII